MIRGLVSYAFRRFTVSWILLLDEGRGTEAGQGLRVEERAKLRFSHGDSIAICCCAISSIEYYLVTFY